MRTRSVAFLLFALCAALAPAASASTLAGPVAASFTAGGIQVGTVSLYAPTSDAPLSGTGTVAEDGTLSFPTDAFAFPYGSADITVPPPAGVKDPIPLTVQLRLHTGELTGSIDTATGRVTVSTTAWAEITFLGDKSPFLVAAGLAHVDCTVGTADAPWGLTLSTDGGTPYDMATGRLALVDQGLNWPPTDCGTGLFHPTFAKAVDGAFSGNAKSVRLEGTLALPAAPPVQPLPPTVQAASSSYDDAAPAAAAAPATSTPLGPPRATPSRLAAKRHVHRTCRRPAGRRLARGDFHGHLHVARHGRRLRC